MTAATTAAPAPTATDPPAPAHPRTRTASGWRGRLGQLTAAGVTDGPQVAEARAALAWWRTRTFMLKELGLPAEQADALLDETDAPAEAAAQAVAL